MSYLFLPSNYGTPLIGSKRDILKECDHPESVGVSEYARLFARNPIAARVVECLPSESWQAQPQIFEDDSPEVSTPFEQAWADLGKSLRGERSWYADNDGNPIWEHLRRADILSGIGHYGIILLGIDDGKELDQPIDGFVDPAPDASKPRSFVNNQGQRRLLFLSVFDESAVQTVEFETNRRSPRYNKPKEYTISLAQAELHSGTSLGRDSGSFKVHWSRVVHIADNLTSSEVYGVPRMRPVLNRLIDLDKLYGGSAEMYWRGAFPGISLETNPQLGGDVTLDTEALRQMMWNYINGLQRYLALTGMTAKSLAPQVVDPSKQVEIQLDAICIKIPIPKRVFMGSERGELASGQDDSTWNDRLRDRKHCYITPRIIVPFIDRLIQVGVLPEPVDGYHVDWPDPESLKPQERADIAVKRTDALAKYVAGQVSSIFDPLDFLTRILEIPEDEAMEILQRTQDGMTPPDDSAAA